MSHVDLCLRFTFIVLVLEGTESCGSESRWINDACHVVFFPSEKEDALSHQACCGSALLSSVFSCIINSMKLVRALPAKSLGMVLKFQLHCGDYIIAPIRVKSYIS